VLRETMEKRLKKIFNSCYQPYPHVNDPIR
jgi:hypothetical protein